MGVHGVKNVPVVNLVFFANHVMLDIIEKRETQQQMCAKHVQQDSTQTNKAACFAWHAVPVHTTTTAMPVNAKLAL